MIMRHYFACVHPSKQFKVHTIYHTVGLNSRKASGKHVKRSEKVLKTSSEKYLLAIRRRPLKLFWFCHCWYFYADIVEEYITSAET